MRNLLFMLLPATAVAQAYYPTIEITEVLVVPGTPASHQVVELTVGSFGASTSGHVFVVGSVAVPLPTMILPDRQILQVHIGVAGLSTPADIFLPNCPALQVSDSIAIYSSNQLQDPTQLIDFVAWGAPLAPLSGVAVQAGRWTSALASATAATQAGTTLANRIYARHTWAGPDAWYVDGTPTLGSENDPAMTRGFGQGCTTPMYGPGIYTTSPVDPGPWLGSTHRLLFGYLPPSPGILFLAFGSDEVGAINLAAHGMPDCFLHIQPEQVFVVNHAFGSAIHDYQVPSTQSLVGYQYYWQALVPFPGAGNPAQALMSYALACQIGSR